MEICLFVREPTSVFRDLLTPGHQFKEKEHFCGRGKYWKRKQRAPVMLIKKSLVKSCNSKDRVKNWQGFEKGKKNWLFASFRWQPRREKSYQHRINVHEENILCFCLVLFYLVFLIFVELQLFYYFYLMGKPKG